MTLRAVLLAAGLCAISFPAHAGSFPSRDPHAVLPLLRAWHEHGSFAQLEQILGKPDEEISAGFSISVFHLSDGTSVYVKATPSRNRIFTINRREPGHLAQTLYQPLTGDLDRPQPSSAPF